MAKFRYYIASIMNGDVRGTNNEDIAKTLSNSEDDFVIDTEKNVWMLEDNNTKEIKDYEEIIKEMKIERGII